MLPSSVRSTVFALSPLILDPRSGRVIPGLLFSSPSFLSNRKSRRARSGQTEWWDLEEAQKGINKKSVWKEGGELGRLVLVCWPLCCPVWLIKASMHPLCVAAGMWGGNKAALIVKRLNGTVKPPQKPASEGCFKHLISYKKWWYHIVKAVSCCKVIMILLVNSKTGYPLFFYFLKRTRFLH